MFKKTLIAAIAFSFVGASFAQAQDWRLQHGQHKVEPRRPMPPHKFERNDRRDYGKHNRWSKGQRYNDWRRHQEIRDYKRYGLRAPARGQRWIKVDDQFLLITAATGLIVGVLAGR
ncbi:RcnB family protein [Brucella melitensis]|uniref:RcnB family protein n=1 Tax=Brucella melitensis TaxID=29459 RepID=UPI0031FC6B13